MFIIKNENNLEVHLMATDIKLFIKLGKNIRLTLSPEKAKELEDKLEKALKEK